MSEIEGFSKIIGQLGVSLKEIQLADMSRFYQTPCIVESINIIVEL